MSTNDRYKGSARSGGIRDWFLQRWTGMILVFLLITHFVISHFHGHPYVTYEMVMERLANPVWKFFDLSFLYLAAYHGVMGFATVMADYKINATLKTAIYSVALAILAYIVIFGTITILSVSA
jgi:succinate dehydrogenase / fumarate reductase membrane anchor subunit